MHIVEMSWSRISVCNLASDQSLDIYNLCVHCCCKNWKNYRPTAEAIGWRSCWRSYGIIFTDRKWECLAWWWVACDIHCQTAVSDCNSLAVFLQTTCCKISSIIYTNLTIFIPLKGSPWMSTWLSCGWQHAEIKLQLLQRSTWCSKY